MQPAANTRAGAERERRLARGVLCVFVNRVGCVCLICFLLHFNGNGDRNVKYMLTLDFAAWERHPSPLNRTRRCFCFVLFCFCTYATVTGIMNKGHWQVAKWTNNKQQTTPARCALCLFYILMTKRHSKGPLKLRLLVCYMCMWARLIKRVYIYGKLPVAKLATVAICN